MSAVDLFSKTYSSYFARISKTKKILDYARVTSKEEFLFNFEKFIKDKDLKDIIGILKTLTNSSIWLSRSGFSLLRSYFDISSLDNINLNDEKSQEIIAAITNKRKINASDAEIFKTIYHEITYSHLHENYYLPFAIPRIKMTIVLVSGMLNEIFSTPAFQRGAQKLLEEYDVRYFSAHVDGLKGARSNALELKLQINEYIETHPGEKLWFFCFSKGGIDTLHYLKHEGCALNAQIKGVSFIATPLLGSDHVNNSIIKMGNYLSMLPDHVLNKLTGKHIDLLAQELQKSLSKDFRENWFKRNHNHLPKNIFYTAIAFESKWHNSHIYMVLTKVLFQSRRSNDGVVDVENAQFPHYFSGMNLGVLEGHHLVGSRSSFYDQEALMKAHLVYLNYKKLL